MCISQDLQNFRKKKEKTIAPQTRVNQGTSNMKPHIVTIQFLNDEFV